MNLMLILRDNKMRILIATMAILISTQLGATDDFVEFKAAQTSEFDAFSASYVNEYETFRREYLADYDKYTQSLMLDWSEPKQTSIDERIVYTADRQARIRIDDVKKTLKIERLDEQVTAKTLVKHLLDDPDVSKELSSIENVEALLIEQLEAGKTEVARQSTVVEHRASIVEAMLTQQQQTLSSLSRDEALTETDIVAAKAKLALETEQRIALVDEKIAQIAKTDPKYKDIRINQISLPNNYLSKRVKPFMDDYQTQASLLSMDLSLLLAISHAESAFDPQAQSHIPAFGLMQIVPSSAGKDVAKKLLQRNRAPSADELFDPTTNIEFGSGYLSILTNRYLKGIDDPLSRKYCVIAAYNTGAGNVARAFNGGNNRSIKAAYKQINAMTSQQVYQQLTVKLPYSETRKYLSKVTQLERQYQTNIKQ
jgi:membrane-bound lytic murein transglycosylase C